MEKLSGVKIEGHKGKWYSIDCFYINDQWIYLMEHETYGEEAEHLIINKSHSILFENLTDREEIAHALYNYYFYNTKS